MTRSRGMFFINGIFTVFFVGVFSFGCYPSPKVPLDTIRYDAGVGEGPRLLFVFLPGNGDRISVFEREGFVKAVRARGLRADMIVADAHIGYYIKGNIFTRLKEDIIDPAKARGYSQIWMIGNSLGGYGSISYAREHPDDLTGVILLGPYLGEKALIKEIEQAGGLQKWDPGDIQDNSKEDWERRFWLWFKGYTQQEQPPNQNGGGPKIFLGYGQGDRFSYGQSYMASFMPPNHVLSIDGGHDWSTWKTLWTRFLDQNIFTP